MGMRRSLLTVLIVLCSSGSAAAGSELDPVRESAQKSRQQVSQLKRRQAELQRQLDEVVARIDQLKEQRRRNPLPGNELQTSLRRSQDLSRQLTEVAQSLSQADVVAQRQNLALLSALSEQLRQLRTQWDGNDKKDARQGVVAQMRALRTEREQIRALLPTATIPVPAPPRSSDDPEDLLEQSDALRDAEDKVREQLRALEVRIAEAREEHELDRRMKDFLGDEAMFDEQDRSFRVHRDLEGGGPLGASVSGRDSQPPQVNAEAARAAEKPPQPEDALRQIAHSPANDSLESLEAQRARLRSVADDLREKARQVESRARELR